MKVRIVFSIVLLCTVFSCTKQKESMSATNDSSLAKVIVNKELVVGVDPSLPPLSFYSSTGKIIGYDVDIAREIANRLGVKLRLVPVSVEDRVQQLESRVVDYLASGFVNNQKNAERFFLSTPYLRDALVVVIMHSFTGETPFHTFADLRNKRIGMVSDADVVETVLHSPLYADNTRQPFFYPRMEKLLIALDYGQLEAAIMNLVTYYSKITKEKKPYRAIGDPLIISTYSYALRNGDGELLEVINLILDDMAKNGKLREISVKWFGADVSIVGKH